MADEEQPAAPAAGTYDPATLNTIIQQLMQQPAPPQPVAQPSSTEGRGALSLLGEAIGGGEQYGTTQQREAAGLRALQSMGMNMMANSGYAPVRTPFGQILASGMQGAQQSLGESQQVEAAQMAAQQQYAEKQQEMQLERLKTVLPLLRMQQGAGIPNLLAGGGGAPPAPNVAQGGSIGAGIAPAQMVSAISDTLGVSPADAAAIASNFHAESGLIPGINEIKPAPGTRGGYGLAQWTDTQDSPRRTALEAFAKTNNLDVSQPSTQLAFMKQEIAQNYPDLLAKMAAAKTPEEKAAVFYNTYEGGPASKLGAHTALAGTYATLPPPAPPGGSKTAAAPAGTAAPPAAPAPYKVASTGAIPPPPSGAPTAPATGTSATDDTFFPTSNVSTSPTLRGPGSPVPPAPSPTTTVAANAPAPQTPSQADQPAAPTGPLTFEQFQAQHPITVDPSTFTVTPPSGALADAIAAKQTAAQNLQQARLSGDSKAENQAQANFTTASQNFNKLQQDAQSKSLELQQAAQKNALDTQRQLYNDEMTRQQQAQLKAQELAQTAAENDKQRQAEIEKARVQLGLNIEQKGAEAGLAESQQTLTDMSKASTEARAAGNQLRLMPGIVDQLPQPGFAAQLAKDHPALIPWLTQAGALSPEQADATQVMRGLVGYMSVGLRPTGSGALRNAEMDRFQAVLPDLMQSAQGRKDSLSLLQTLQDRIVQEHDFASRYFRRPDPTTGKPSYNLDGLPDAIDAPRSQGGLGPIAPTGPQPVTTDANGQARRMTPQEVQQWVHDNVGVGHAYWGWAPVGDGTYKQKLMVRRDHG